MNEGRASAPEHLATIEWERGKWLHVRGNDSREPVWRLAAGAKLRATDGWPLLQEGYRDGAKIDAQELFVAVVSSAYMLSWLHLALGMGIEVVRYSDDACRVFSEISEGVHWISEVILSPKIVYDESSRAIARSLNSLPNRATVVPPCPEDYRGMEATTTLTQGRPAWHGFPPGLKAEARAGTRMISRCPAQKRYSKSTP